MPSNKPKILFVMEKDLFERIEDFRFNNRIASRSDAIRRLIESGLASENKSKPKKK